MASIDLIRSCLDSIRQVSNEIEDSLVYLDSGTLEAFQIIGAFPLLLEFGARAVCSLENMSPLDVTVDWNSSTLKPAKKMVVFTACLLSDVHRFILRCLVTHQTILHCSVFTSISETAHSAYIDSPLGPDAFHEYKLLLLQDYEELWKESKDKDLPLGEFKNTKLSSDTDEKNRFYSEGQRWSKMAYDGNDDASVDPSLTGTSLYNDDNASHIGGEDEFAKMLINVYHLPMIFCPLSPRVFVLPPEGTIAEAFLSNNNEDSLSPLLPTISTGLQSDTENIPPGATLTAHFLYHLAAKMDLKLEIFSLGDTSRIIGKMLTDMSSLYDVGRRNKRSAGLLLVDRTLDLVTPCCHGDSLIDQIVSSLRHSERNKSTLTARNLAVSKKSSLNIERSTLDVRIPLPITLSKDKNVYNTIQLSEKVTDFLLGWNISDDGPEIAVKFEHEKVKANCWDYAQNLLTGSFFSRIMGSNYLDVLLYRRAKDGVMLIKNWLLEALQREKIPLNIKGRLGLAVASELRSMVSKLASDQKSLIRNKGIIQLALATENALNEPHSSHWDAFVSAERILSINCGDTSQSLSNQIRDLINTSTLVRSHENIKNKESSQALISLQDALLLSMVGYILAGDNFPSSEASSPFSWEEERSLKEAVVDAILEKPSDARFKFLHGLEKELDANVENKESRKHRELSSDQSEVDEFDDQWSSWNDEDITQNCESGYGDAQLKLELRDRVDQLFELFHKLAGIKWRNPAFRGLIPLGGIPGDTYTNTRKTLLYKILSTVFMKSDFPGLEYHSSTVGRLLKSGFGRFGLGQAKPSPGDQSVILIFVIGGINCLEVREAMEAISESRRPDVELILGGTALLTPDDMFELLLGSSSYI